MNRAIEAPFCTALTLMMKNIVIDTAEWEGKAGANERNDKQSRMERLEELTSIHKVCISYNKANI